MSDRPNFDIAALKAGDRSKFARLVEETSPKIYRLLLKMLGDEADAEDALQDAYLKALRSLPNFEERSSLSTWLYRIAVNEALMVIRKRKPQVALGEDNGEDAGDAPAPVELADFCCLPEGELMSGEGKRQLNRAVQTLSPALRAVFLLRDVEDLSVRETAEALGVSEQVVKTRLLRARLKLREELSAYWSERVAAQKVEGE